MMVCICYSDGRRPAATMDEKTESETSPPVLAEDLIAVGIGASAGGLEACSDLLRHLPPATGMAFILVQHLDPHHESALPELLAAKTQDAGGAGSFRDAHRAGPRLRGPSQFPDARPHNRSLVLEAMPATQERFRPIDVFFYSLAEEFRFNAVGVVLSGTASDGTWD